MKLSEARAIVAKMVQWSMIGMGVDNGRKPDPITEDLKTLLRANQMVENAEKRHTKRINKILEEKGHYKSKGHKTQMILADRGIAALYVAANFQGDDPGTADVLGCHMDNLVFCLSRNAIK
jgi:hypothetical protein